MDRHPADLGRAEAGRAEAGRAEVGSCAEAGLAVDGRLAPIHVCGSLAEAGL